MFENPRIGRQTRNFTTNAPTILDLKSSSEQIFSKNWRWIPPNYLEWAVLRSNSADNQKVFLQPLRTGLKRNQFARDTFAWPESRFAICLVDSWMTPTNGCLGLCCD